MYHDELAKLSKEELIALGLAQAAQIEELTRRVAELEAKLGEPPKTPDNSSVPPSQGKKPHLADKPKREGPRKGSLGRKGGGRALVVHPGRDRGRSPRLLRTLPGRAARERSPAGGPIRQVR